VGKFQAPGLRSVHLYLLAAVAVLVGYLSISQLGAPTSSARTETETVAAAYGVVQTTDSGSGSVEAGVDDEVNFATSGTLEDVYVHEGESVKEGQILATLDPTSAKLTLAQAELSLEQARVALTDAEDGDTSTASSVGSSSSDTSNTADSGVEQATLERVEYTRRATTTTSAKTKPSATRTVTVTVPSTTPTGTSTSSETTTTSATTIEADELTVQSDEETVASDQKAVDETTLRAPVSGTIASLEDISSGDSVSADSSSSSSSSSGSSTTSTTSSSSSGTTAGGLAGSSSTSSSSGFAEIVNTKTLAMTVAFSEADIGEIKVGQPATVTLDALSGVELAGRVSAISSTATEDDDVVSYGVTLTIDQTDPRVRPGMSATAAVIVDQADGVTVPTAAVSGSGSEGTVTLVRDGKRVGQEVVVGLRGSSRTEIASGLKAGQDVLITETLPSLGESTTTTSTSSSGTLGGSSGFSGAGSGTRGSFGGGAPGGGGPP